MQQQSKTAAGGIQETRKSTLSLSIIWKFFHQPTFNVAHVARHWSSQLCRQNETSSKRNGHRGSTWQYLHEKKYLKRWKIIQEAISHNRHHFGDQVKWNKPRNAYRFLVEMNEWFQKLISGERNGLELDESKERWRWKKYLGLSAWRSLMISLVVAMV